MALTRRFFTNLAAEYKAARPGFGDVSSAMAVWLEMVTITANALAEQNAMFNYQRFYEACGMEPELVARLAG
jgi:hypothetical protein